MPPPYAEFFNDHLQLAVKEKLRHLHYNPQGKRNYARIYRVQNVMIHYSVAFRPTIQNQRQPAEVETELFFSYSVRDRNLRLAREAEPMLRRFEARIKELGYIYKYDDEGRKGQNGDPMNRVRCSARFQGGIDELSRWPEYCSRIVQILEELDHEFGAWIDTAR